MMKLTRGYLSGALTAFVLAGSVAAVAQIELETKVSAPFMITGEGGKTLLIVEERSGGPLMTLFGNAGATLSLGAHNDWMAIDIRRSTTDHMSLILGQDGAAITIEKGGNGVVLVSDKEDIGLTVNKGQTELAHLGLKSGYDVALRIQSLQDQPAFILGSSSGDGGAGALRLYDSAGQLGAFINASQPDGGGIGIAKGGNPVVVIGLNQDRSGGLLNISDVGGSLAFTAGQQVGGGGGACIYNSEKGRCYGPNLP